MDAETEQIVRDAVRGAIGVDTYTAEEMLAEIDALRAEVMTLRRQLHDAQIRAANATIRSVPHD